MSSFPKVEITQLNLLVMEQGNLPVRLNQLYVEVLTPDTYIATTASTSGSWPFWTPQYISAQQINLPNHRYMGISESSKLNQNTKYNINNFSKISNIYNTIFNSVESTDLDLTVLQHLRFQFFWRTES